MPIDDPSLRVDRSVVSVCSLKEQGDDRAFWQTRTPQQRIEALELLRQTMYGYDPATTRLQRVIEVVNLASQ